MHTFSVGETVVFHPVGLMQISRIGPRHALTPAGHVHVGFNLGATIATGASPLETVEPDDEVVYALRFVGEDTDFMFLPVLHAAEQGLRRASSDGEISAFLTQLAQAESDAESAGAIAPDQLLPLILNAGNDLTTLARLYPSVRRATASAPFLERNRRGLEEFFLAEISHAKGISEDEARRLLASTAA